MLIGLALLLVNTSVACSKSYTNSTEYWKTYTNNTDEYSIGWPPSWCVIESASQPAYMDSPDGRAHIAVLRLEKDAGLDETVEAGIRLNKERCAYYELIYNNRITHQGMEARVQLAIHQNDKDSALMQDKSLYIISGNWMYWVYCLATQSDYSSYSETFDQALESFRILN